MTLRTIRRESGLVEFVCEHGVGHPVWGSADFLASYDRPSVEDRCRKRDSWMSHGCDGCCSNHFEELLYQSVEIGNDLLHEWIDVVKDLRDEIADLNREIVALNSEIVALESCRDLGFD